jgi:hypothetical protein
MGRLQEPNNTFWQLVNRPENGGPWTLVTPKGVADNGGLVLAADAAPGLTTGFVPSQELGFSPLAHSADSGRTWTPSVLPAGLASVPDALASGPAGTFLALVRRDGGAVLAAAGTSGRWRTVLRTRAVAASPAGRACGVVRLSAVAGTVGAPTVAGSCSVGGVVGVFTRHGAVWRRDGPHLPGVAATRPTTVLRWERQGSGTVGLVASGRGRATSVYEVSRASASASWVTSSALPVGRIMSTGVSASGSVLVVTTGAGGVEHAAVSSGHTWTLLPRLPARTAAVVAGNGSDASGAALVVSGKRLITYVLVPAGTKWVRSQVLTVPLVYGSST